MFQSIKNYYHLLQAIIALIRYGFPANGMTVIGVTGTDGKTTTASMIYHILNETGHKTALISTVAAYIDGKKLDTGFHVSTPDSMHLQAYIAKAKEAGSTHLVLEVTSHALDQNRVWGVPLAVGVLTNISYEHLDYHKTMKAYTKAKLKLLMQAKIAIINADDSSYEFVARKLRRKNVITYAQKNDAMITVKDHPFKSNVVGSYNTSNALAALAVGEILGIDRKTAADAISTFILPEGRYEVVYDKGFKIIVDFAHTPHAIESVLTAVREDGVKGRLIHVFGSAGERDKGKRPMMGKLSQKLADWSIITSEDVRHESPETIATEILSGMSKTNDHIDSIIDRQDAITRAVTMATQGDVIIITGKGHEKSMNIGKGEETWSDQEAVKRALKYKIEREG